MAKMDHNVSRRQFLTGSLGSMAAAGLVTALPRTLYAEDPASDEPGGDIIYRTLGRTGIQVPIVSMGVMNNNIPDLVGASYDLGVRHFDTAARYQYGRNEQMVGNVIAKKGVRDRVVVATKIMRPAQRGTMTESEAKSKITELCEGSLRRLKMDHVDILYIHSVSEAADFSDDPTMAAMEQLKKDGKVRAVGVSTHRNMADVIEEVTRVGFYDVVLTAVNVSMADDARLWGAIETAAQSGVGIVAMKTQAGGSRLPNAASLERYSSTTVATASLKWVMRHDFITTAIPGYDNFEHMREDLSVMRSLSYTDEEKAFLSDNELKLSLGYCRQCAQCVPSCPHGVEVPTLMRTYMYAAQYANFHEARAALAEVPQSRGLEVCAQCARCLASCGHFVDIPRRIETLREIYV